MERYMWLEVVARGKEDDYKAWFDARNKIFERLGLKPGKMYEVQNRTYNMVCVISPEMTPEEFQEYDKCDSDEGYLELQREHRANPVVIDGTTESYRLTTD